MGVLNNLFWKTCTHFIPISFISDVVNFRSESTLSSTCVINMDIDTIINSWIDYATSEEKICSSNTNLHHFNITYALHMSILNTIQERKLSVEKTMPKVLKLLNLQVKLPT